ncbi:uncharacterized protein LOC127801127 isoform X2 [Diospyros lotus]|uniref:uncharacterized protein LOC127801127 isoform X2 n=1 Tax=Diospyros lotus TaxID=55363 RepID=UPI002256F926|nr:uncharacterized protein LOC127801127 isoform X2 [Diospyros lotus]
MRCLSGFSNLQSSTFSFSNIQEMDAIISSFNALETKEAGLLILSWAVYLCLISSLPEKQENNVLMDIDHVGYVRQAFEAGSLSYFLEILQSDILKDSDGPNAGYRSVLRTFVSAFIASYEISLQLEDNTLKLILDILCKIYRGEESLCIQFWDRDSFIDGPIRCLLCNLEGEFPFRTAELVRFLSALSEGSWPAKCVYSFLDKSVGISSLFEISTDSFIDKDSQIVETHLPLCIPGVEGLFIPANTRGHILKVIEGNTALIRWEYSVSGVLVLLLQLARELYLDSMEEVHVTLDLLSRLVSFNMAICYSLLEIGNSPRLEGTHMNGHMDTYVSANAIEIICSLVKKISPTCSGALIMSMSVNILSKMIKCSPSLITVAVVDMNIFDVARMNPFHIRYNDLSSGSWLLSGRLANMLLIDCEHNASSSLTLSVLDFTIQLVETGVENDVVLALVAFNLQYVLVNHEYWKYKVKHARWKVTLKVLDLMKKCILSVPYCQKLSDVVRDILVSDSSIHNVLFRIVCTTAQAIEKLYVCRFYELMEIEGLQQAICNVLDILVIMLSNPTQDTFPGLPVFHHAMLSPSTKPIPVATAMISLISFFRNPKIQVGAAKVLCMLFALTDCSEQYLFGNAYFDLEEKQILYLRRSINSILYEQSPSNEDLFVAMFKLLISAAHYQPAFLLAVIAENETTDVQASDANGTKHLNDVTTRLLGFTDANPMAAVLEYVGQSNDLINSNPRILLNVLNFLKALWQGAAQFTNILDCVKSSENFWKQLTSILQNVSNDAKLCGRMSEVEVLSIAYRHQCQSSVLKILAYESFLQKKLLHAESLVQQTGVTYKDQIEKTKDESHFCWKRVLSTLHGGSILDNLIKSYASCEYDNELYLRAKVAAGIFSVHVMEKLRTGDTGSLSVSLIEKIRILFKKLSELPSFSDLLGQYTQQGYSEGKELQSLILSDLYYHLQGEIEGRKVDPGPFKALSQYLIDSKFLQTYQHKYDGDLFGHAKNVYLFDSLRLRSDLGLDMWDYSNWKASKAIAENMLLCLEDLNSMVLLTSSKLSALKSLTTILSMNEDVSSEKAERIDKKIPQQLIDSCINQLGSCLQAAIESLVSLPDASENILEFIAAQVELLLHFVRFAHSSLSMPTCVLILKVSGSGLKLLSDLRISVSSVKDTVKLSLMLLLSSVISSCKNSHLDGAIEMESVEAFAEASNASLGLLPVLCSFVEHADNCTLSLAVIDFILKSFLMPNTWFPIIQKHLQLQHLVLKLQHKNYFASVPVILKFLLTIARVRDGAEMLMSAGFLSSLKVLFSDLTEGNSFSISESKRSLFNLSDKIEKPQCIWGLGLAVVTAIVESLGDSSSCADIVDYVIAYFFSEKAHLISYYLDAPAFPSGDHDKKRARAPRSETSLSALKETENTLALICELAKHWHSWTKAMKEMDSQLRERSIHLLAFISKGTQYLGESPSKTVPLLCHPVLKEEFEWYKEPSFINARRGWFALSPLGYGSNPRFSAASSKTTALGVKGQGTEATNSSSQTYFSDTIAIQMYRIAFLLLKFLCLQAEGAVRRSEEVGFIDLAHFPELPVPEILHGLQDQGIAVVTELCEANKLKQVPPQIRGVCVLLLQITEMALYLELCVSQICGIRPVLGHVEDFSKELKLLMKATEGHAFLKGSMKSLKQIASYVYPGLLQNDGFF